MKYKANRNCGICGNKYVEKLHNLKFQLLENIKLPDNYNIVFCNECGFVYADTTATQEDYNEFYKNNNIYENAASYSDFKKYELTFDYLKSFLYKKDLILDIGFANGELLKMFKKEGFKNLYGLDPSESCVKNSANDFKIYHGDIFNHNITKKFDCIILSHVMEHILDIPQAMKELRKLLSNDGLLYIEVPDLMQYKDNNASPFNYFDIEHINHFSKESLKNLIYINGFYLYEECDIKKWKINDTQYYPATYVLCKKRTLNIEHYKKEYVIDYISECLEKKYNEIEELTKSQESIIVWGTGSFTQRLYEMAGLSNCNIEMYVDNNNTKIGTSFDGKIIQSPEGIKSNNKILILSVYGVEEIKEQIKEMRLKNEIITISV